MKRRLTACLISGIMLTSSAALMPVHAAAEDPLFGTLPDWVPNDFVEAIEFINTYGCSHAEGEIACLVRRMPHFARDHYDFSISGSMTYLNTPACTEPHFYELEIPEKPDPDDAEAVKAYQAYCDRLGVSYDYSFFENYVLCKTQPAFEVEIFRVIEGYDLNVTWLQTYDGGETFEPTDKFSFANVSGETAETDLLGWLPDSPAEYNSYKEAHKDVSLHDNYVVFCITQGIGTAYEWTQTADGSKCFELAAQSSCNYFELEQVVGGSSNTVYAYKAVKDGSDKISFAYAPNYTPEQVMDTLTADCTVLNNAETVLLSGEMRVSLVDWDTGALIPLAEDDMPSLWTGITVTTPDGSVSTGPILVMESNPAIVSKDLGNFFSGASFSFGLNEYRLPAGYSIPETEGSSGWFNGTVKPEGHITVTSGENGCADVIIRLKSDCSGDLNGDGELALSDAVFLIKWLLGDSGSDLENWQAADFNHDGKLNALDLSLMKRVLLGDPGYVKPDIYAEYPEPMHIMENGVNLYTGPGFDYPVIMKVPGLTMLNEIGYQKDESNWIFTNYNGRFGWIPIKDENGESTLYFMAVADKPVIYLYPETETDVHVELELTDAELSTTYPKYNGGWDVTAYPDGTLLNQADGTHHRYLFWDAVNCRMRYDFSEGFCVAGADTERFLKESLTYMGLSESEMNEFIVYWLPRMEHNAYNLIAFQGDAYTDSAKLNITPQPDSLCRIFMAYVPLKEAAEIAPQTLPTFERTGFTVVEWGGSEIRTNSID